MANAASQQTTDGDRIGDAAWLRSVACPECPLTLRNAERDYKIVAKQA
jgi:hypothetical protein